MKGRHQQGEVLGRGLLVQVQFVEDLPILDFPVPGALRRLTQVTAQLMKFWRMVACPHIPARLRAHDQADEPHVVHGAGKLGVEVLRRSRVAKIGGRYIGGQGTQTVVLGTNASAM